MLETLDIGCGESDFDRVGRQTGRKGDWDAIAVTGTSFWDATYADSGHRAALRNTSVIMSDHI